MQKIYLEKSNRLYLQTEETVDAVTISIVNSTGSFYKDASEVDLEERNCTLDESSGKFFFDVTLSSSEGPGDAYLYWVATLSGICVPLEASLAPEDAVVLEKISTAQYLVSPSFVIDNYLQSIDPTKLDYDVIRDNILAATEELQKKTLVFFTPRVIEAEFHDYDLTPIFEKYWTNFLFEFPIISIEKLELRIHEEVLAEIPLEWIQVGNKNQAMVKVLPYSSPVSGFAFRLVLTVGAQLSLIYGNQYYYPDFFVYSYTAGLDWDNLPANEKKDIQLAIGRRVAIKMLPNLDEHRGISSESQGIDGATASRSYTSSATFGEHSAAIKEFKTEEKTWVNTFKRKYNKRYPVDGFH